MSIVERAIRKLQSQTVPRSSEPGQPPIAAVNPLPAPDSTQVHTRPMPSEQPTPVPAARARVVYTKSVRIDRAALRSVGLLPPEHQEHLIANQYRQIKRPLIANATGKGSSRVERGNLIMVASAIPGEGKSFTSLNLALSLAREQDLEVVLVDADVAKPHISDLFGMTKELGLLDCIQDDSLDVFSLIVGTDVPRLSVLPAGRRTDSATELLASARMETITAQLTAGDVNRIVIFDSPPLLLTSESRVLSGLVGQVVLVVRAGSTSQQAVLDAVSLLADGKSVGLVLNQSEVEDGGRYYGYGSGQYGARAVEDKARDLQQSS